MKKMLTIFTRLLRRQDGVAFIEFAISLPFLLLVLLGGIEMTNYILVVQKVEKIASTVADLTAQESDATTADMDITILAASQVMQPYIFTSKGYVIVSSVTKTGSANPIVNWQYKGGGTATQTSLVGSVGSTATMPAGFSMADKDNVIITEVFYSYSPLLNIAGNVIGSGQIYKTSLFKPRLGDLTTLSVLFSRFFHGAFA